MNTATLITIEPSTPLYFTDAYVEAVRRADVLLAEEHGLPLAVQFVKDSGVSAEVRTAGTGYAVDVFVDGEHVNTFNVRSSWGLRANLRNVPGFARNLWS